MIVDLMAMKGIILKLKLFGFWIFHIFFIHSLLLTHTIPSSFQSPLFSTTYSYAHTYIFSKLCLCLSSNLLSPSLKTNCPSSSLSHTVILLRRFQSVLLYSMWCTYIRHNLHTTYIQYAMTNDNAYNIHTLYKCIQVQVQSLHMQSL